MTILKPIILTAMLLVGASILFVQPRDGSPPLPRDVVTVDYWEKWGGSEAAAMQRVVELFNRTVGREKGIYVRYLSMSNIQQKTLVSTAAGVPPDAMGPVVAVDDLHRLPGLDADVAPGRIAAPIRNVDCYGNVQLTVTDADMRRAGLDGGRPVRVGTPTGTVDLRRVASCPDRDSGELGIVEVSFGWLAIVAGGADAATRLDLRAADAVRLGDA